MSYGGSFLKSIVFAVILLSPGAAFAQIALVDYDTIHSSTILTANSNHAGVYIANACLIPGEENKFRVCNEEDKKSGTTGIVLQRYSNLSGRSKSELKNQPNKDWIAMPFNDNLYGAKDKSASPILVNNAVLNAQRAQALDDSKLHLQDLVNPQAETATKQNAQDKGQLTYQGNWKYAIDASAIRTTHTVGIAKTTPKQDQAAVDYLNNLDNQSHFQQQLNNCANFASNIFNATFGKDEHGKKLFHGRGKTEDAFLVTPGSVAKGMKQVAKKLDLPYEVNVYNQTPTTYKRSSAGTELAGDSNTGLGVSEVVKLIPSPPIMGSGTIFTLLKYARKMGMPLPGYRPFMDVSGKETKQHGTNALAEASFELDRAKKAKDKQKEAELKLKRQALQNETFGTKSCWKDKRESFKAILADAMKADVVDKKYEKDFKMRDQLNKFLRMVPMLHLNPSHSKLISDVMNSPGTTIDAANMTITKDGVTAGLNRENITQYDPKLGFLIMASSLVYQLDSDEMTLASDFDADWATLVLLAQKNGITVDSSAKERVAVCGGKVDPSIELPVVSPAEAPVPFSPNTNCADCMVKNTNVVGD